ncbi:MAG: type II toxin-antitoxin system VapB family antitoxin [Proteobacteria bacterium]|nr:type II toxin-antitoxin system VapB family antitoxin [Pseudomonadota bacterium]
MRTTIILKDDLVKRAMELTNIQEKTTLIHVALEALIARAAADRLAALGGSDKKAQAPSRRRAG